MPNNSRVNLPPVTGPHRRHDYLLFQRGNHHAALSDTTVNILQARGMKDVEIKLLASEVIARAYALRPDARGLQVVLEIDDEDGRLVERVTDFGPDNIQA